MDPAERIALYSIAVNLRLVIGKYGLAVFSGSLALRADAIHSCADIVSAASIWAGIRISRRKTRLFPYGLYKVENLMALFTVGLLALGGYEIVHSVLTETGRLRPTHLPVAMAGVVLIIAITLAFSRFELKKGSELGSPSLVADARHIGTDMFSAAIILVGLIGEYFRIKFPLDKVVALVIVVFIAWVGIKIALDAIRVLLDASVDFSTLNDIRELILENPEVVKIKSLTGRNSGRFKFIEAELALKIKDFQKAHLVTGRIEAQIKAKIAHVDRVLIHYEPVVKDTLTCALPLAEDRQTLSEHFGEAPYFLLLIIRANDRKLLEERLLVNTFSHLSKGKGIKVAEWLLGQGVDEAMVPKSFAHKGPYYVFADAGAEMHPTEMRTVAEIKTSLTAEAPNP